jgi:hypothetical protein
MANEFKKLLSLFKRIKKAIKKEPTERNAHFALILLLNNLEEIEDPNLASNFQSHWLDIANQIKKLSNENYFARQKLLIELNIERIMFPELAQEQLIKFINS